MRRSAITVTLEGEEQFDAAMMGLMAMLKHKAMGYVGTNLVSPPYPYFLEYGTSRMPAYPSARPAFDEQKEAARAAAADTLGQLISSGNRSPDALRLAALAGTLPIMNRWKELARIRTGTYRRSIHNDAELVSQTQ